MPSTLGRIPITELGGTAGADLRRRGLDELRDLTEGREQQLARAGAAGRGTLPPRREAQLTRQTAGTQLTPSQIRPPAQPPAPEPGQIAQIAGEEAQTARAQMPVEAPPQLPQLPDLATKAQQLAQEFTEGSRLFGQKVSARISQKFGNINPELYKNVTKGARHLGLDIAVQSGVPLQTPVSGKVAIGLNKGGFGAYVKIFGDDGTEFRFSHLSEIAPEVVNAARTGQPVKVGTWFGRTGGVPGTQGAGRTTGAHLDITVRRGGKHIDPLSVESVRRALQ